MNFINKLEKHFRIYNYIEIITILLGKEMPLKYNYTCNTFAATILDKTNIELEKSARLYRPHELYNLLEDKVIYKGNIFLLNI